MLPPKRQNLFPPFATTFDGDPAECSKHLGRARGMLSLMCRSIPPVKSRTETTTDGVEIRVTTNPNHVYIKAGSTLFCTSFNEGDLGTQIYKKIDRPITRDGLIPEGNNPNELVLPSPTYSSRTNYWVDTKEKNTVSWGYVDTTNHIFNPYYEPVRYARISINGIENDDLFGRMLAPLSCAIIEKGDYKDKLVIIYRQKLRSSPNFNKVFLVVCDYVIDFDNIVITELLNYELVIEGVTISSDGIIIGFMGDGMRLVIYSTVDRIYYPVDYPMGITIHVSTINVIEFNATYTDIFSNDIIYEALPLVSEGYNFANYIAGEAGVRELIVPTERVASMFVDVRGEYVSFSTIKGVSSKEIRVEGNGPYFFYVKSYSRVYADTIDLVYWSKGTGITREHLLSTSGNTNSTGVLGEGGLDVFHSVSSSSNYAYVSVYSKKHNEAIYSDVHQSNTSVGWEYDEIPDESTQSINLFIKTKKMGEIYNSDLSLGGDGFVLDYAYTNETMVASIAAFDYDSLGNETDKSFTLVSNMKSKYKIIPTEAKNISLTKLP